jgi:heme/copper-type cytochrome/quinol oxidase subunit 2
MRFKVHAVPADRFAAWMSGARRTATMLDAAAYAELAKQSSIVAPTAWRPVCSRPSRR